MAREGVTTIGLGCGTRKSLETLKIVESQTMDSVVNELIKYFSSGGSYSPKLTKKVKEDEEAEQHG